MKIGLVLEGGAMRGLFTAGVLDFFLEKQIRFDAMIGVSAGALFACSFKSNQKNRSLRYNLKYCNNKYLSGGVCNETTAHPFNGDDFYKFTVDSFAFENYQYHVLGKKIPVAV